MKHDLHYIKKKTFNRTFVNKLRFWIRRTCSWFSFGNLEEGHYLAFDYQKNHPVVLDALESYFLSPIGESDRYCFAPTASALLLKVLHRNCNRPHSFVKSVTANCAVGIDNICISYLNLPLRVRFQNLII